MSLFDELFAGTLGEKGESRPKSPEVAPKSPAENGSTVRVIAQSPRSPGLAGEKVAPTGEAPCPACGCGSFWRGQSGAWRCEQCAPPGDAHVRTWRSVSGAKVPPTPPPAVSWPADLNAMLRRVSVAFEWSQTDVADFRQWAQRSPDGMADARAFLEAEAARLPQPGLSDRRRVVMDMLAADPAITYAWTCTDTGADPVTLTLAIRGKGTVELAIPRAKFDALELPMLIERFTSNTAPADPGINGD